MSIACANQLSAETVKNELHRFHAVDPMEPSPPPGVVFADRPLPPAHYQDFWVHNAEGQYIQLKDVAEVEAVPRDRK